MVEKWCIWSCFLIGFCIEKGTFGSEEVAEVVEKWCIWSCFLIGFCMESFGTFGSEMGAEVVEKSTDVD